MPDQRAAPLRSSQASIQRLYTQPFACINYETGVLAVANAVPPGCTLYEAAVGDLANFASRHRFLVKMWNANRGGDHGQWWHDMELIPSLELKRMDYEVFEELILAAFFSNNPTVNNKGCDADQSDAT